MGQAIAQQARLAAFLMVALLLATTACYTVYVAQGVDGFAHIIQNTPSKDPTYQNTTANTSVGPLLSLPPNSLLILMAVGGFAVVGLVWIMALLTTLTVIKPANMRNPGKLLDIYYMNMLFGFVFWPLAAIGALIPAGDSVIMLALGFIPALVLTRFVSRFVEEGIGNKLLFIIVLVAIGVLIACNGIAWGGSLTGGWLYATALIPVVPPALFMFLSYRDQNDPILTRPLIGELFLWSALGVILGAAVGMGASGGFGGAASEVAVVTGLFQGFTPVIAPFTVSSYAAYSGVGATTYLVLPALFGILGVLSAVICLIPLLLVGDLYLLQTGLEVAESCSRCHRPFLALKVQDVPLCNRCRARTMRRQGAPGPGGPSGPAAPPPGFSPSA